MLRRLRLYMRAIIRRSEFERTMDEELRFHIEQYTEDLIRSGVAPLEAARRARVEFGGLNSVRMDCRETRGLHLLDELSRDLTYALRLLRKETGFTVTALATLAVCIGANLTIFALVNSILLRPLPFPDADRLVTIYNTYPKAGVDRDGSSLANYYERRGRIAAFSSISIYRTASGTVAEGATSQHESILRVSPDFFTTLGAMPMFGRPFTDAETTSDTDHAAILSYGYWEQHFASDPSAIGRSIRVNDVPRTIVGILPADFHFLSSAAGLYLPLASTLQERSIQALHSGGNTTHMIARLKPGVDLAQAQAQIDVDNAAVERRDPIAKFMSEAGFRSVVASLQGDHVASVRPMLWLLQAGALALLAIGAVNLANLFLIRAGARVKELAIRQALGARRRHILGEVVAETAIVTSCGCALGLALSLAALRVLAPVTAIHFPLGAYISHDWRTIVTAIGGTVLLALVLAIPMVSFAFRNQVGVPFQGEGRTWTASRGTQRAQRVFVIVQIALTLNLLVACGLLGLSLQRVLGVPAGFRPDHVLSAQVLASWARYPTWDRRVPLNDNLLTGLARQPGVISAGLINNVPFSGTTGKSAVTVVGYTPRPGESGRGHYSYGVDGDYFNTMGFALKEGRFLTSDDSRRSTRACVVDEDFARYYWPGTSPLGQRLFFAGNAGSDDQAFTVVGLVGTAKQESLSENSHPGAVYYPYEFRTDDHLFLVVRTTANPESFALTLQQTVRAVDAELPVFDVLTMADRLQDNLISRRSPVWAAAVFSFVAILLTVIGTYGVLSYSVVLRRREIGIRMALGAHPEQIRTHFLVMCLRLLIAGIPIGILAAWLTAKLMQSMLFQVPAFHAPIYLAAVFVIGLVCFLGCLIPALRAARTSPRRVLAEG